MPWSSYLSIGPMASSHFTRKLSAVQEMENIFGLRIGGVSTRSRAVSLEGTWNRFNVRLFQDIYLI